MSFDPGLSPKKAKELIVDGAQGGVAPVINAYESLRSAAEEPGAPLCGNDVWEANGSLETRRKNDTVESLFSLSVQPAWAWEVEVLHGGKHILHWSFEGGKVLGWNAASRSWGPAPLPPSGEGIRGGTAASVFGDSHAQDTFAYVHDADVNGTPWFVNGDTEEAPIQIQLIENGQPAGPPVEVNSITVNDFPGPLKETCLERNPDSGDCFLNIVENRTWLFRLAYPQFPQNNAGLAYVTVTPMRHVEIDSTDWAACSFNTNHECREILTLQGRDGDAHYRVDLTGSTPTLVETIDDEMVTWIGTSENGERVVLGRGRHRITFWADAAHYYQTGSPFYGQESELERCVIDYRDQDSFSSAPIAAPNVCSFQPPITRPEEAVAQSRPI